MQEIKHYFEFIRYAMNPGVQSVPGVNGADWHKLYQFCREQAIAGVLFEGVKRLSVQGVKLPFDVLMQWIATAERIEGQNRTLNKRCIEVVREYQEAGFKCCVLKGQGNATMYPNLYSRMPGDIDIWVRPRNTESENQRFREIVGYVRERHPENMEVRYYHVGYQDNGVEVELHFMPGVMNNPWYNNRLQKWFATQAEKDDIWNNYVELPESIGSITIPSVQYNLIHQLAHMMHHFFDEGIGLRQMMDYYFVLKALNRDSWNLGIRNSGYRDSENLGNTELGKTLRYLGLWKFAGTVMYVMQEVFALEEQCMIAPVDERRGKTLLAEILKGGNFGKYSGLTKHSAGGKYFAKTWRNIKLVGEYPAEALCEPFFRTWHYLWRLAH